MKKESFLAILFFLANVSTLSASNEILLKSRHFTPAKGVSDTEKAKIEAIPQRAHVIIQLEKIPTIRERKELEVKGIKLLSYVPNKAWFASIPSAKAGEIASLSKVRSICEILPQDKIDRSIREKGVNNYSTNEKGEAKLVGLFFDDVSLNKASAIISNYNGTVIGTAPIINALVFYLPKNLIDELASHDSVHWIDQHYEPAIANDGSRAAIHVEEVQASPYNLTGAGVIAGEWDGGCVEDTHHDLWGRVIHRDCSGLYPYHATHVAGTMLGNGSRSFLYGGTDLQWRGMATSAAVVSYHWWFTVPELYSDYDDAINTYGIDLSTHSWGITDWDCEYDLDTQAEDNIVTGAYGKRISIMRAAGNEGDDSWSSLRSNAVAKNVVTVGATKSDDDSIVLYATWGSSLGPTADGRIKPDVMAPGCESTWNNADPDKTIWSTDNVGNDYFGACGTSMATPAVSGSVALMLEDWRDNHSDEPDPLPSTIKAILIQTAKDLVDAPCNPGPDYSSGYGLIHAQNAIDLIREDISDNVILENSMVEHLDTDTFLIDVPHEQSELKITLVWDDYPGDPAASEALVNDLDLIVKGPPPNQTRYYPWTLDPLSPEDPAERTQEDHLNNVEQVWVENPASGTWTIEISETEIPEPQQLYSLVSNIKFGPIPPFAYDDFFSVELGTPVEITLKASDDGLPNPPGALSYIITSLPSNGPLTDAGGGQILFVPYTLANNGNKVIFMTNLVGSDNFTFKANDGGTPPDGGDSEEVVININIWGTEGWWKFNEGSGNIAYDSSGYNHGILMDIPHDPDWLEDLIRGWCLDFDVDDEAEDYVSLSPISSLTNDYVTISAWIRADILGEGHSIFLQKNINNYGYELSVVDDFGNDNPIFYLNGKIAHSPESINAETWYHIAGTNDGSSLKIYVDGVLKDTANSSGQTGINNNAFIGYLFDGKIDDVRVYNYAMDQARIYKIMSQGTPKFSIKDVSGKLVAWFDKFGNLFLKGSLDENSNCQITDNDEFVVRNATDVLAIIDRTNGNMCLKGKANPEQTMLYPEGFIVISPGFDGGAYIDNSGDLWMTGKIYMNQ